MPEPVRSLRSRPSRSREIPHPAAAGARGNPLPGGSPPAAPPASARPFLKWAGGKGRLLKSLAAYFPKALAEGGIEDYYEPFLGGGALFFHVMQAYPVRRAFLMDANEEIVLLYKVVQNAVEPLIARLEQMERDYRKLSAEKRRERYLKVRAALNRARPGMDFRKFAVGPWVERASQLLFLNKTCYNGLFRVNREGGFNTPFGRYANPTIADADNLRAAAALLRRAQIRLGDFGDLGGRGERGLVKPGSFIYYDPPYRPLSRTASFTAYSRFAFGDAEQERLARLFRALDRQGVYQMLSNSDPRNADPADDFFERAYADYRGTFWRVPAARAINSVGSGRGNINEIVITNYRP
jgi:DNA adenine methylase